MSASSARAGIIKNSVRTVVLTGQQAIIPQGAVEFSHALFDFRDMALSGGQSFQTRCPLINNRGEVAFVATTIPVSGEPFTQDGIWTERNGAVKLITEFGERLPGVEPSVTLRFIWGGLVFNDRGEVAFKAITSDDSSDTQRIGSGIWAGTADTLRKVATNVQPASAVATENEFLSFSTPLLNNQGRVAFAAQIALAGDGSPSDRLATGIWSDVNGAVQPVALKGQTISLPSGPATLAALSPIAFGDDGKISVYAYMDTQTGGAAGYLQANVQHLHTTVVERHTQTVGDTQIAFSALDPPSGNTNGGFVFGSAIGYQWVLAASHDDKTRVIAADGDIAPGTDKSFQRFDGLAASINSSGRIAFRASLYDYYQTYMGIWSDAFGPLELVVRGGDSAPGANDNQVFLYFSQPQLNARGDIAFTATLIGPGIDFDNDEGIWVRSTDGMLQLIAREGGLLEVAPNDFRQIATLAYGGDFNGTEKSVFNDTGQLVFAALFTDGTSGVFVSNVAAVPEPTSMMLLTLTVFLSLRSRMPSLREVPL